MSRTVVFLLVILPWTAGFSQSLSFKFGTPFQRADLDVRWGAPTNTLPSHVWIYRLLPNKFRSQAIDYLLSLGPFTYKDRVRSNANEMLFEKPAILPNLFVSYRLGQIRYQTPTRSFTNLAQHVPGIVQLPELTRAFLNRLNIDVSEITKKADGSPNFGFWEPSTEYAVNDRLITNVEYRAVDFRRAVDGAPWVGGDTGGDGQIQFGDYGKPTRIWLSWRSLQRYKQYPSVKSDVIINWIHRGRAVQNMIPMDAEPINWGTVKSLTITRAKLCYYAGGPFAPSDWLMPFVALWATVDRGHGTIEVEIDCPIIDSTKVSTGNGQQ